MVFVGHPMHNKLSEGGVCDLWEDIQHRDTQTRVCFIRTAEDSPSALSLLRPEGIRPTACKSRCVNEPAMLLSFWLKETCLEDDRNIQVWHLK